MIRDNQVVVISGETGCGKTTQVKNLLLLLLRIIIIISMLRIIETVSYFSLIALYTNITENINYF